MRWFRLFGKMFFELSNYQLIKKRCVKLERKLFLLLLISKNERLIIGRV